MTDELRLRVDARRKREIDLRKLARVIIALAEQQAADATGTEQPEDAGSGDAA